MVLFAPCRAAERSSIDFTYPSFEGDFYVSGTLSFAPGAVAGPAHLQVRTVSPAQEVPAKKRALETWPDGSILTMEVTFEANASRRGEYYVSYGDDVRADRTITETAVLPSVPFSAGGAPRTAENVNMDVGQLNVTVDRSPGIFYYWHLVPIVLLTALALMRARRVGKPLPASGRNA